MTLTAAPTPSPCLRASSGASPAARPGSLSASVQTQHKRRVEAEAKAKPGLLRWLWHYMIGLQNHGILIQAVGVPLRHVLAVVGLVRCFQGLVGWRTYLLAWFMWPLSGLGVTAGAHRLWSHQAYSATPLLQVLLMIMFSCADQGSIQGWALTHAMHHSASDTKWDPHNRREGFWHAHFGWLFSVKQFRLASSEWHRVTNGLGDAVHFHDRVYNFWDPLWSLCFPALIAYTWGEAANGFFVAGALRWLFVQHVTFFVNSMGHGEQTGSPHSFDTTARDIGPRVSLLTTVLALGEGWHDYHHLFPWDYAAAELGAWDQWNPTKVFIDTMGMLGLAYNRRRSSDMLQTARRVQLLKTAQAGDSSACERITYAVHGLPFLRYRVPVPAGKGDDMDAFPPAPTAHKEEEDEEEEGSDEEEDENLFPDADDIASGK